MAVAPRNPEPWPLSDDELNRAYQGGWGLWVTWRAARAEGTGPTAAGYREVQAQIVKAMQDKVVVTETELEARLIKTIERMEKDMAEDRTVFGMLHDVQKHVRAARYSIDTLRKDKK